MKLKNYLFLAALTLCVNSLFAQQAQTERISAAANLAELPRFELAAQFTSLSNNPARAGFGGRLTFNLNRSFALEAEGSFFLNKVFDGRAVQGLFGVKAGKRFDKFGIFAKARPGFVYYSKGKFELSGTAQNPIFATSGRNDPALDIGGVIEFYPTKRLVTRFDAGDTITRVSGIKSYFYDQSSNVQSLRFPARAHNSFQLSAGIGFRF